MERGSGTDRSTATTITPTAAESPHSPPLSQPSMTLSRRQPSPTPSRRPRAAPAPSRGDQRSSLLRRPVNRRSGRDDHDRGSRAADGRRESGSPEVCHQRVAEGYADCRRSWCRRSAVASTSSSGARPSAWTSNAARADVEHGIGHRHLCGQQAPGRRGGQRARRDRHQGDELGGDCRPHATAPPPSAVHATVAPPSTAGAALSGCPPTRWRARWRQRRQHPLAAIAQGPGQRDAPTTAADDDPRPRPWGFGSRSAGGWPPVAPRPGTPAQRPPPWPPSCPPPGPPSPAPSPITSTRTSGSSRPTGTARDDLRGIAVAQLQGQAQRVETRSQVRAGRPAPLSRPGRRAGSREVQRSGRHLDASRDAHRGRRAGKRPLGVLQAVPGDGARCAARRRVCRWPGP